MVASMGGRQLIASAAETQRQGVVVYRGYLLQPPDCSFRCCLRANDAYAGVVCRRRLRQGGQAGSSWP